MRMNDQRMMENGYSRDIRSHSNKQSSLTELFKQVPEWGRRPFATVSVYHTQTKRVKGQSILRLSWPGPGHHTQWPPSDDNSRLQTTSKSSGLHIKDLLHRATKGRPRSRL